VRDDQDQLDRIAEKRVADEAWRTQKPTQNLGPAAPLHPVFLDIFKLLGMPQRQPEEQS
jgi:hypothetical protein